MDSLSAFSAEFESAMIGHSSPSPLSNSPPLFEVVTGIVTPPDTTSSTPTTPATPNTISTESQSTEATTCPVIASTTQFSLVLGSTVTTGQNVSANFSQSNESNNHSLIAIQSKSSAPLASATKNVGLVLATKSGPRPVTTPALVSSPSSSASLCFPSFSFTSTSVANSLSSSSVVSCNGSSTTNHGSNVGGITMAAKQSVVTNNVAILASSACSSVSPMAVVGHSLSGVVSTTDTTAHRPPSTDSVVVIAKKNAKPRGNKTTHKANSAAARKDGVAQNAPQSSITTPTSIPVTAPSKARKSKAKSSAQSASLGSLATTTNQSVASTPASRAKVRNVTTNGTSGAELVGVTNSHKPFGTTTAVLPSVPTSSSELCPQKAPPVMEQPITILNMLRSTPKSQQIVPALVNQSILDGQTRRTVMLASTNGHNGSAGTNQLTPINISGMTSGSGGTLTLPILSNGNAISFPGSFILQQQQQQQQTQQVAVSVSQTQQSEQKQAQVVAQLNGVLNTTSSVGNLNGVAAGGSAGTTSLLNIASSTGVVMNGNSTNVVGQHQLQQSQSQAQQPQIIPISTMVNNGNKIAMLLLTPNVAQNGQNGGPVVSTSSDSGAQSGLINGATVLCSTGPPTSGAGNSAPTQQFFLRTTTQPGGGQANQIFAVSTGLTPQPTTVAPPPPPPPAKNGRKSKAATSKPAATTKAKATNSKTKTKTTTNKAAPHAATNSIASPGTPLINTPAQKIVALSQPSPQKQRAQAKTSQRPAQAQAQSMGFVSATTTNNHQSPSSFGFSPPPSQSMCATSTAPTVAVTSSVIARTTPTTHIQSHHLVSAPNAPFTKFIITPAQRALPNSVQNAFIGKTTIVEKTAAGLMGTTKFIKNFKPKPAQVDATTQTDSFIGNEVLGENFQTLVSRYNESSSGENCTSPASEMAVSNHFQNDNSSYLEEYMSPPEASQVIISGHDPNMNTTVAQPCSASNSVSNSGAVQQQFHLHQSDSNNAQQQFNDSSRFYVSNSEGAQLNGEASLSNLMLSGADPLLSDNSPPSPVGGHSSDASFVSQDNVNSDQDTTNGVMFSNFLIEIPNGEQREDFTIDGLDILNSLIDNEALNNRADFPINDLNLVNHVLSGLETEPITGLKRSYTDPGTSESYRRVRISNDTFFLRHDEQNSNSSLVPISTSASEGTTNNISLNSLSNSSVLMSILTSPAINRVNASSVAATQQFLEVMGNQPANSSEDLFDCEARKSRAKKGVSGGDVNHNNGIKKEEVVGNHHHSNLTSNSMTTSGAVALKSEMI